MIMFSFYRLEFVLVRKISQNTTRIWSSTWPGSGPYIGAARTYVGWCQEHLLVLPSSPFSLLVTIASPSPFKELLTPQNIISWVGMWQAGLLKCLPLEFEPGPEEHESCPRAAVNKVLQTGWLKTTETVCLIILEATIPKSSSSQGQHAPSEVYWEEPFPASSSFSGVCWQPSAFLGCINPVSALTITLSSPACLCLSSHMDTSLDQPPYSGRTSS